MLEASNMEVTPTNANTIDESNNEVSKPLKSISIKHKQIIDAYFSNGYNMSAAVIKFGGAVSNSRHQGTLILARPEVQQYIADKREDLSQRAQISLAEVIIEYKKIAFFNPKSLFKEDGRLKDVADMTDEEAAAIESIEIEEIKTEGFKIGETKKVKLNSKAQALRDLMKHLGGFEADNKQKAPVNINNTQIVFK